MTRKRNVFKTHGGKTYLAPFIMANFPDTYTFYGESCIGGGSILISKEPSQIEVINDIDSNIINLYSQLKHNPKEFIEELSKIEYNEDNFNWAKNYTQNNDLQSAVAELCVRRMSRGGLKKSFSWSNRLRGGQPGDLNAFNTFKEYIKDIVIRIKDVEIENLNILDFIKKYDSPEWFLYLDPPYLHATRRATKAYDHEMSEKDHQDMLNLIVNCKCKILLSGYISPLYMKALKSWNFNSMSVANHSGQTKVKEMRVECVWKNY